HLMRDRDIYIHDEEAFINSFFNIREYPFLPVVDGNKRLLGILTHSKLIDVFQHSWGMHTGGYLITASSVDYKGALKRFIATITQYANIEGLLTLDDESRLYRRLIVTLSSKDVDQQKADYIVKKLENQGYKVVFMEKIEQQ